MAQDLNTVSLVGRLTRPCDVRYTNSGYAICSFSIAVKRHDKVNGNWEDVTSFFDCTYFGKAAEGVSPWLQKGQQVAVQGSLKQETWTDKTTNKQRSKVVIVVDYLSLIGGSKSNANSNEPRQNSKSNPQQTNNTADSKFEDDPDIPF